MKMPIKLKILTGIMGAGVLFRCMILVFDGADLLDGSSSSVSNLFGVVVTIKDGASGGMGGSARAEQHDAATRRLANRRYFW
ncbi:MAG: hypothetical protein JXR37_30015 [Kiritimatiellae bacterium]|nr:hypothetical protein [Kiritimatiellia bacterium]